MRLTLAAAFPWRDLGSSLRARDIRHTVDHPEPPRRSPDAVKPVSVVIAHESAVIDEHGLASLVDLLANDHRVIAPVMRDGALALEEVDDGRSMATGSTTEQDAGHYRVLADPDGWLFGDGPTSDSWRRFLFPPRSLLVTIRTSSDGFETKAPPAPDRQLAFVGVRSCDLAAIGVTDRVFLDRDVTDPIYDERRSGVFVVALGCRDATASCFCASVQTGPRPEGGYDLLLTEVHPGPEHRLVAEAGSARGAAVLGSLDRDAVTDADIQSVNRATERAAVQQRAIHPSDVSNARDRHDHPRWDDVAERCLACANCTLVCPTCFCSATEEVASLDGQHQERWRRWDSCFTDDHSVLGGEPVRPSTAMRYRQWLTHKLITWHDQFDTSGCVGCGRCITWCPPGIDLTEEIAAVGNSSVDTHTSEGSE